MPFLRNITGSIRHMRRYANGTRSEEAAMPFLILHDKLLKERIAP